MPIPIQSFHLPLHTDELKGLEESILIFRDVKAANKIVRASSSPDIAAQLLLTALYIKNFYPSFRKRKKKRLKSILN